MITAAAPASLRHRIGHGKDILSHLKRHYDLYLLLLPGFLFLLVFEIFPLCGIIIAFKDYNMFSGTNPLNAISQSPWAGLKYFREIFSDSYFYVVLRNTIIISLYKLFFLFPVPVVLAVLLNEVKQVFYKRLVQTLIYLPHFISWPVIFGLFFSILGSSGIVNRVITTLGGERILFFMDNRYFRSLLVFTQGWKESGWGTIIYLAAISGIDPQLYEAAVVDGAGRVRQIMNIMLPGISSTIVILLILRLGNLLQAGFAQILAMYNPSVYDTADIIQTYVYRTGLGQLRFSYGTAFGLFNTVISFILIFASNRLSKIISGRSIW